MRRPPPAAWLLTATVVLTAANLRPAVASVGAVLRDIQAGLGMSDTVAGVLTTLPLLSFGLVGLAAGRIGRRFGLERALVAALALLTVGLALRGLATSSAVLLLLSALSLVSIAVANVLVPVAVRHWFPGRVGRITGLYTLAMALGATAASALSVPIGQLWGGWRGGIAFWALPAAVALLPWVVLLRERGQPVRPADDVAVAHLPIHRSIKAWCLAVFFGLQSLEAYVAVGWLPAILQDAGLGAAAAGLLLGITMGLGGPIAVLLPELAARFDDQRPLVVGLIAMSLAAYLGLVLAPATAPLLWSILLGIGLGAFPLALVLIGLRAATPRGTSDLSALTQGAGYLLAASGPVAIGALHELTGGWEVPLWLLVALLGPKLVAGWVAAAPGHVDVEVAART